MIKANVVRVVDINGNPSTASISDLEKEFVDNKDYSSMIKANVGSGGGASRSTNGGGAPDKKLSEMTATEQSIFANKDPQGYQAAVEAEKKCLNWWLVKALNKNQTNK